MKFTMIALVLALLFTMQSAFAAKPPSSGPATTLPGSVKPSAAKPKTFAPPVMQEQAPQAAAPVQVGAPVSAFEQGSESAANAEEPEASQPLQPAGNAMPAQTVQAPVAPKARLSPQAAPRSASRVVGSPQPIIHHSTVSPNKPAPAPAPAPAAKPDFVVKKAEIEVEQDDDGETEVEAEVKLVPVTPRGHQKAADPDYVFTDEELGISPYLKKPAQAEAKAEAEAEEAEEAAPAPRKRAKEASKPLVDLPEPIDGYSPEYQEGMKQDGEESAADDASMLAGGKAPGSTEFDMATVDMLADSIEPTGEVSEVAKRK